MNENPDCQECVLHHNAKSVCLAGVGPKTCKLAIWFDSPAMIDDKRGRSFVSDNAEFVRYCLKRMSIDPETIYFDYVVKCYAKKLPGQKGDRMQCVNACSQYRYAALEQLTKLKAIVVLGSLGCEMVTGIKEVGKRAGANWEPRSLKMQQFVKNVWVGFSPGLVKEKPSEAGSIYRVIWMAAEQAGLNPTVAKIEPYYFEV